MKTSNILSPIYSTTIKIGTNDVEAKNWSIWSNTDGNWRPREEDVWKGDGTTNDQTADEDPSASESFTLNTYNAYDNVGNILSETDANGVISKYLYADGKSNLILKATNTGTGNIVADNFNDNSFSDSDPFTWTTSSGWSVSDGELQSPLNSISYARIQNYQFQSFKADVQAKINNNGGLTTYWVGILFGTTSTAYTTGGYLVYYRDNGYLALYQNGVNLAYVNTYLLPNKKERFL
ncbi:MAG: hypothetical protein IPK06_09900 [Ignavibacteriae bacterium]|nr:hypothetical protein [Ignavibacteriota bacterium]